MIPLPSCQIARNKGICNLIHYRTGLESQKIILLAMLVNIALLYVIIHNYILRFVLNGLSVVDWRPDR